MSLTHLKSRIHRILEAIIQTYAESGVPVGSEVLCQRYNFGLSSATIRNVMVDLEGQGLITHPHTSAGRIPTDKGYRYYADVLMEPKRLSAEEQSAIDLLAQFKAENPFELLEEAAELLTQMTRDAGVVLVPQLTQDSFRNIRFIQVDRKEVVGVLISSEGLIKDIRMELEEAVGEEELARIERFLNQELAGMPLSHVDDYMERALLETKESFFQLNKRALELLSLGSLFEDEASLILEGASAILEAPEFQDIERTRRLLKGLEAKEELAELLRRDLSADEVRFHIGSENRETSLTDCTIAAAPYRLRGGLSGALGVLGPTRMDYPRVSALVRRTAQAVTRAFEAER
jgi:heat-inducible transcriptional repressor